MKSKSFVSKTSMPKFELWDKLADKRVPLSFDLEITARCNNACRHCYINLPAGDIEARKKELSLTEINDIADQAVDLGALWCLISGGEPLLREDFARYLYRSQAERLTDIGLYQCLFGHRRTCGIIQEIPTTRSRGDGVWDYS